MTTETRTYEHTLPTGETMTFKVGPSRFSDDLCVTYPAGVDFSAWRAEDAYPMAEIEHDYGCRFHICTGFGEDDGVVWESWSMRYQDGL